MPTTSDQELHNHMMGLIEDAREQRRPFEGQWWENLATWHGDMFSEWNPHSRRLEERPKARTTVRLPVNLAKPAVRTEYAKLLKNRPIVDCMARSQDQSDLNSAKVGNKMLYPYAEKEFRMPRKRRRSLIWTLICGSGGIFTDYDPQAKQPIEFLDDGHGNPVTDPATVEAFRAYYKKQKKAPRTLKIPQGELIMEVVSPFALIYDLSKIDYAEARWTIIRQVMDVSEVKRRWNEDVDPEVDVYPGVIEQRLLARFDRMARMNIEKPKTAQLVTVYRFFAKPGAHYNFPEGAHIAFTKQGILAQEPFPFMHGNLPVGWMGHIPAPMGQFDDSTLGDIRPINIEIARTESQLIQNRNLMANPPWRTATQHRIEQDAIVNRPGLRLEYTHHPNVPPPEPVQMPEMPQYVKDLIPMLKEHILEISGQGETSQGKVPEGVRAGVMLAYLAEEDETKLGPTVQEYEEMIEDVSWHQLMCMAQFYEIPRTVRIYKKHGEPEVFDFVGTQLSGVAGCVCQAGSALPRSKAAKQQFILDLYDKGLEQDPRKVREMLELSEGEPDEWQTDLDQAERENWKLKQGQQQPVEEWYNHPAHHYTHRKFMKSADFEVLPVEAQQAFRDHDALHTQMEQKQQAEVQSQVTNLAAAGAPNPETLVQGAQGQQGPPQPGQGGPTPPPQFQSNGGGPIQAMEGGPQ